MVCPTMCSITYTTFGGEPIALPSAGRRFVGSSASTSIVLRPEETWFTPAALHAQLTTTYIAGGAQHQPSRPINAWFLYVVVDCGVCVWF